MTGSSTITRPARGATRRSRPRHRRSSRLRTALSGWHAERPPEPGGRSPRAALARPPIDPRIRQRRIAVQRWQGRRRLHLLLAGLTVVGALVACLAVLHSPLLGVHHVRITGAGHVSRAEVMAAAKVGPSTPLVDVDPARVEQSLERLPWVARATVARDWPTTLVVHLTERVPVAQAAAAGGGWAELDRTGHVLARSPAMWAGLVAVSGIVPVGSPGAVEPGAAPALAVAAALPSSIRPHVAEVKDLPGGQVDLLLSPRGTVELGTPTALAAKLRSVATMMSQVDLTGLRVMDVRVPDAPTLTRG